MPAAGGGNTRARQRKAKPRPRPLVPHGPGGQNLRPAAPARRTPRNASQRAAGVRVVQRSAARVDRQESAKARRYLTQDPIKGLARSERRAISALSDLRSADPKRYDANTRKANPVFGNPEKDAKNPVLLRRFKRAQESGALIDAGAIPALVLRNIAEAAKDTPNIARATWDSPGRVFTSTAKSLPGLTASAIAGLAEVPINLATGHGGDLAKSFRADTRRRYNQTGAQKRARYKAEGIAPEAIDLSPAVVGGLGAVGEAAGGLARAGRLGAAAGRLAKDARPALHRAAGEHGAVPQELSSNLLKAATQKAVDRGRSKKFAKRSGKVDQAGEPVPIRGLVPGTGEVVKKRLVAQRRDQRIDVSRVTGRGFETQKRLQDREVRAGIERERRKLSKGDRDVETLALQGLIHHDDPEVTKHLLGAYREKIVAARAAAASRTPHKIPSKSDELARIDRTLKRLDANPGEVLTPALREFHGKQVDRYHRLREADTVNASDLTAEVRRHQPLGRVFGEHHALDRETARIDEKLAAGDFEPPGPVRDRVESIPPDTQKVGQAEHRVRQSEAIQHEASQAVAEERHHVREGQKLYRALKDQGKSVAPIEKRLMEAADRLKEKEARLAEASDALKKARGEHKRTRAPGTRVVTEPGERVKRAAPSDKATAKANVLKDRARRKFVARTRARAEALGLPEPVYVGHRPRAKAEFGAYAAGGAKAIQGVKRSQYKLFDEGRADTTGAAYTDSVAQGIKRNVNWNTVSDTLERHTPEWGRNLHSREGALKVLDDKGLAHGDWRVVDLGRYRKARGEGKAEDVGLQGDPHIHDAVKQSTYTLDGVPADFASTGRRLSLVPAGVAKELEDMTKPSGVLGRTAQKVQGIQSKLILGTNPTFVPVQFAANLPLAALATKGNLVNWLHGHRAWKELDGPTKDWIETRLGASSVSSASSTRPRYGAITNESSALLHNYRVFADSKPVQGVKNSKVNPLNWNAKLDDLQNNFFRRTVFKADMGKEARKFARGMDDTRSAAEPLAKVMAMPDGPAKMAALRKAEPQAEKMAKHVNEMLGDYSRFTVRERKLARTTLLFYPFLRWALKFTFYTLPVKHPYAAQITAKLGQLHKEEVIHLLGEEISNATGDSKAAAEKKVREFAPSYAYGRIYYNKGKLQSIDFSRITPLATQAFDIVPQKGDAGLIHGALKTLLGSFSPLGTSILKASIGRDPVTGQPLQVGGHKTPFGQSPRMTTGREAGVILRDAANLNPILRTALRIRDKGKMQGDDLSTITAGLTKNDLKKLAQRATAQGKTSEAVLDAAIPFRKKGELLPGTIYRHAVFDALRKIGELKDGIPKGTPLYISLTHQESDLKRKIGALPPKKGVGPTGPLTPAELREMRQAAAPAQAGPLTAAEKRELLGTR